MTLSNLNNRVLAIAVICWYLAIKTLRSCQLAMNLYTLTIFFIKFWTMYEILIKCDVFCTFQKCRENEQSCTFVQQISGMQFKIQQKKLLIDVGRFMKKIRGGADISADLATLDAVLTWPMPAVCVGVKSWGWCHEGGEGVWCQEESEIVLTGLAAAAVSIGRQIPFNGLISNSFYLSSQW